MKSLLSIITVFSMSVISIPALSVSGNTASEGNIHTGDFTLTEFYGSEKDSDSENTSNYFSVLNTQSGEINKVPVRDYVIGAVCAEMPASFSEEALKAQAVASHTYALYQKNAGQNKPELNGADFSDDPSEYQAFFTSEDMHRYYGDRYDEYYQRVSSAVDTVISQILVYDNEPIVAAFHSLSSGTTESAENIWGQKIEYLVPCESGSDTKAPGFTEEYTFTADEIRSRLQTKFENISFPDDCGTWFSIDSTSCSGTVLEMTAGNTKMSGTEFREILSVRSAVFEIKYTGENKFNITTKGYGHGVGMSQYGANAMAEEGRTYSEILEHYYKGAHLETVQ